VDVRYSSTNEPVSVNKHTWVIRTPNLVQLVAVLPYKNSASFSIKNITLAEYVMLVTMLSVADASVLIRKEYKLLMDQYIFHSSSVLQSPVNDIVSGNIHIGNDSMRCNRTLHHKHSSELAEESETAHDRCTVAATTVVVCEGNI